MLLPALLVSLLFVGATAAPAQALVGIYNSVQKPVFGNGGETAGGLFGRQAGGPAVNATGAGGVGVGDVYFADTENNRVQRFTSDGVFVEAWGWDVVTGGAGNNNAIQSLTVKATAGQFKLTFGAATTGNLPYNASAAEVRTALEGLVTIGAGNVSVSGGPGDGSGSVPYGIVFTGTLGGSSQPAIVASNGIVPLSGGTATATVYTVNAGGATGFEICKAGQSCKAGDASSALGGAINQPQGLAVDPATGNVYVTERGMNRVDEFTATGTFVRAIGRDVVTAGKPEDRTARSAKQTLTVKATSGTFTLEFEGKKTADLPYNASAAAAQAALAGLSSVGAGNLTVAGGPGDENGTTPYVLTFAGALQESPQPLIAAANGSTPLAGGEATATVVTTEAGSTNSEVCVDPASCKAGTLGAAAGAFAAFPASGSNGNPGHGLGSGSGVLAAPNGAPNAGNLLVTDPGNSRVQEFSLTGQFIRAFGFDVAQAGPGNTGTAFEVCRAAGFDVCKGGATGNGVGQFAAQTPTRIAEDSAGNVYTVEPFTNFRVQRFTLPGNSPTPQGTFDATDLSGSDSDTRPTDVSVGPMGHVFVVKGYPKSTLGDCMYKAKAVTENQGERRIVEVAPDGTLEAIHLTCGRFQSDFDFSLAANPATGRLYLASDELLGFAVLDNLAGPTATVEPPVSIAGSTVTLRATVTPALTYPSAGSITTRYHFQVREVGDTEWRSAPDLLENDPSVGNGSGSGDPSTCPVNNPPLCEVAQPVAGLRPESEYEQRLVVYVRRLLPSIDEPHYAPILTVDGENFTTVPSPPEALTGAAHWSSPPETGPSLTFEGEVNPSNVRTTYHFDFVDQASFEASGWSDAHTAPIEPSPDAEAGQGIENVLVKQTVTGLDPEKTYRYRLVARNVNGSDDGIERTVVPAKASERFYELVSNGDSEDMFARFETSTSDGERALMTAGRLGEPQSLTALIGVFGTDRTPDGWKVYNFGVDPKRTEQGEFFGSFNTSSDLRTKIWYTGTHDEYWHNERQFYYGFADGTTAPASMLLKPLNQQPAGVDIGSPGLGSYDYDTFIVLSASTAPLLPGNQPLASISQRQVYKLTGGRSGHPTLMRLSETTGGQYIGGGCGVELESATENGVGETRNRMMSYDGSSVIYQLRENTASSCASSVKKRVYRRIDATEPVQVSASECNRIASLPTVPACETTAPSGTALAKFDDIYRSASSDGSKVLISSKRQLTNSDTDNTRDLYIYDSQARNEIQKLLVNATAGSYTLTVATGRGTGTTASGSKAVTGVTTQSGAFSVGDRVFGTGIPASATIAAIGAGTLELSANATAAGTVTITAAEVTAPIAFDAPASGSASLGEALTALVGVGAGNVTVTGGGVNPYQVEFNGPQFAGKPQPPMLVGIAGLTGTAKEEPFVAGGHLTQITEGQVVAGDHPTVGFGAEALGSMAMSMDGSRVYFAASGRLTPDAAKGANNVYVYERDAAHPSGRLGLVTKLSTTTHNERLWVNEGDSRTFALPYRNGAGEPVSGDGHIFVFSTDSALLPADIDTEVDVYRFDDTAAPGEALTCVSCEGSAPLSIELPYDTGNGAGSPQSWEERAATEDGRGIIMTTAAALSPEDHNGAQDVYLWRGLGWRECEAGSPDFSATAEGCIDLISPGDWSEGIETPETSPPGISADGRDIFFASGAQLVATDDDSAVDVYDARIGGGFPAPPTSAPTCQTGLECHGGGDSAPATTAPGSASFTGPGNSPVKPFKRPCPKGKVRRHGRCVKKHDGKHREKHRQRSGRRNGGSK